MDLSINAQINHRKLKQIRNNNYLTFNINFI